MLQIDMDYNENENAPRRIFGIFHFFHKFSIYSFLFTSTRFRYIPLILTVATVLLMIFRFYWMFWQIDGDFLSFTWAESKMFAFLSLESVVVTIALGRMGYTKSMQKFEKNLANLVILRVEKCHKKKDDYRILWIRTFVANLFVFLTFTLTSIYLAVNREVTMGSTKKSSWYWIMDPIAAILCGYSNFLFLPVHALRSHAITREFEVFNDELEKADQEKKLANLGVIQEFGARQIKLFEYANFLTDRIERYMTFAPALSFLAFLMSVYIVSEFSKTPPTLFLICIIAMVISCFIISFALMYPVAFIQEAMSATSRVLLNSSILQETDDPLIYQNYRMILDRTLHNRATNNVLHVFTVTRKNVERAFFAHTLLIIVMCFVYSFEHGITKGFEGIGKLIIGNMTHP